MSHLIKVYIVCKFSYFRLWYLNRVKFQKDGGQCNAIAPDSAILILSTVGALVAQWVKRWPTDLAD